MSMRIALHPLASLVALASLLATLLLSCQPTTMTDRAKDQTLRLGWASGGGSSSITTLDPAQCADASCIQPVSLLFDGLVTIDRHEHIEPWGASSWIISLDGLTYTFRLRPNQRFSDGTPVMPSDYAWSIDRSVNPCLGSPLSYYLSAIKDASVFSGKKCVNHQPDGSIKTLVGSSLIPDDSANTLTITLEQPAGYFLAALTYSTSFAIEKSVVSGDDLGKDDAWLDNLARGTTGQGGSGMFYVAEQVEGENDTPGLLRLKQNPHWWGKKPNFTEVDFKLFVSTSTEYSAYQTDQKLAFADTIPVDQIASAKGQRDYYKQPALIVEGMLFNWKIAPFDDLNARKAFCLAINREQLNQQALQNRFIPGWHIVPQGMDGYNAHLKGLDGAPTAGDATLARTYWQRYLAAHHNVAPRISIPDSSSRVGRAAISFDQESWSRTLGVQVNIYIVRTIFGENIRNQQLARFGWMADYPDPQDFLSLPYRSDSSDNASSASVAAADTLMRQADTLTDMAQRIPLYQQAEQLLIDNVAVCPLFQYVNHYALRPWVKGGFEEDGRGLFPNDAWVSGYIANH